MSTADQKLNRSTTLKRCISIHFLFHEFQDFRQVLCGRPADSKKHMQIFKQALVVWGLGFVKSSKPRDLRGVKIATVINVRTREQTNTGHLLLNQYNNA